MERGRGGPGRRWLRAGVIAGLLGLAALGGGPRMAAQTGPLPVTVLPRQPGLTVPEYVPGQVVVLFHPDDADHRCRSDLAGGPHPRGGGHCCRY